MGLVGDGWGVGSTSEGGDSEGRGEITRVKLRGENPACGVSEANGMLGFGDDRRPPFVLRAQRS